MRILLVALVWSATVAGAFALGATRDSDPVTPPAPPLSADEAAERASALAVDAGPILRAPPSFPSTPQAAGAVSEAASPPDVHEPLDAFTLEGVTSAREAMAQLMRHVLSFLAQGKGGHKDLLAFLDTEVMKSDAFKALVSSEADASRFLYPWIEMMVQQKERVVDVAETVYETLAEDPAFFANFEDDTLEIFTEGASFVLPGAVSEERLAVFREHAKAFLALPEESLPASLRGARRDVSRMLRVWAPELSIDEAVARIQAGDLSAPEILEVLRTLPADRWSEVGAIEVLAPMIGAGDYQAMRLLDRATLAPRDLDLLDRALLQGAAAGQINEYRMVQYLRATDRGAWPAPQRLLEAGLDQGGPAARASAMTLCHLPGKPPADYVRWVLDRGTHTEDVVKSLKAVFQLD